MPGGLAAGDFDLAAGMVENFSEKFDQGFVGGGIDGWGGYLHLEFITKGFADFVAGGAGDDFDGKQSAAGGFAEESSRRHKRKGIYY